jgi:broad specificity phosphatase PhoE
MTANPVMTRWWWIRHAPVVGHAGRIYGNLDVDCDCGDAALFQALAAGLPRDAVWIVTPLSRTRATAEAILRHHQDAASVGAAGLEVEPQLAEQNFGTWQGLSHAELAEQRSGGWHRFWLAPAEEEPPGGESFAALAIRVAAAIERLTERHAGRDIVCVSHGGPIRAALAKALGITPEQALSFVVDNCSLTRLDHFPDETKGSGERKAGSWRITQVNARLR